MGYLNEFPHVKTWDSDLREILEMFVAVKELPKSFEELRQFVEENGEELGEEFTALKTFVETYFDNLDVQDEIKAKLEDMYEKGWLEIKSYVTPQMFGAKADANYYDVATRTWWKDSSKTAKPTDDGIAIQKAIDYAINNNIHTIFFSDGNYYCPNRSFNIDTSKLRFVGENTSKLISVGLTYGAFITLTSPLDLKMYDYARVPLENICIEGVYNDDSANTGVTGVVFGEIGNAGATMVSPHMATYNLTIKNFHIGLWLASAYKSSMYNPNIIACNYGIYVTEGGVVPWNCYCPHIECCYFAFYSTASGYAEVNIFGGAFEYNRFQYSGTNKTKFIGTRFEFDLLSACNSSLSPYYPFYVTGDGSPYLKLIHCSILSLSNFTGNVGNWIPNPYVLNEPTSTSVICAYSNSFTGKAQIYIEGCEIATDGDSQYPDGNYYVSGGKIFAQNNQYYGNCGGIFNPDNLVTETNGLLV